MNPKSIFLLVLIVVIVLIGGIFISKYKKSSTELENDKILKETTLNTEVNLPSSDSEELLNFYNNNGELPTVINETNSQSKNNTLFPKTNTQTPSITTTTTPTSKKITVNMTDNDFSPSSVSINKGDIVVFVNNSNNTHWPASNTHPTHEIYPEFDPRKPISSGSSWEFKFEKTGSWKMHDHLSPRITGTITVN